ncbi:MAG: hypothetical protein KUG59_07865 [Parvibaculaceae bacterium]|nr:hypothetical protein [Parvibaculaceae bacterium]
MWQLAVLEEKLENTLFHVITKLMEKLSAYILVIALLMANLVTVAHADCFEGTLCGSNQTVISMDDTVDQSGEAQAPCECCAIGPHCHGHASLSNGKIEFLASFSQMDHSWRGDTYSSQLDYPPSKPPQA